MHEFIITLDDLGYKSGDFYMNLETGSVATADEWLADSTNWITSEEEPMTKEQKMEELWGLTKVIRSKKGHWIDAEHEDLI